MTAAELLRSAAPPADDGLIDKAIADLDVRIWEWADALKSAHTQLRSAFAVRASARPSESLYESVPVGLSAAAAAAHVPSPPPMPAEWTAPPVVPPLEKEVPWAAAHGGHGASAGMPAAVPTPAWPEPPAQMARSSESAPGGAGVMAWPTAPSATTWPEPSGSGSAGAQSWPTWTPTDTTPKTSAPPKKSAKPAKPAKPVIEGPTPEERAQKAAAEEALLSELEDAIARRVRLLRRLDPDTAIEKLIEKAKQGQAETAAAAPAKDDKSSWWRRK